MILRFAVRVAFCAFFVIVCRHSVAVDATSHELKLTDEDFAAWREHILPAKTDLGWQQIPWLTTFQDGILDADQRNMPLLFWTMNGHPLGCT